MRKDLVLCAHMYLSSFVQAHFGSGGIEKSHSCK